LLDSTIAEMANKIKNKYIITPITSTVEDEEKILLMDFINKVLLIIVSDFKLTIMNTDTVRVIAEIIFLGNLKIGLNFSFEARLVI